MVSTGAAEGNFSPQEIDCAVMDSEQRARQDQLRSAKRALRLFQQRRIEQARRRSRFFRGSISLAKNTPAVQSQASTNTPQSVARNSRRSSRTLSSLFERRSSRTEAMQRWSQLGTPPLMQAPPPNPKRTSRHMRTSSQFVGSTFVGSRPASIADSKRMSFMANTERQSRHARMSSIATKRESAMMMNGVSSNPVRASRLQNASILFNGGPAELPSGKIDWREKLREVQHDDSQEHVNPLDRLEGRSPPRVVSMSLSKEPHREPSWLAVGESNGPQNPDLSTLTEESIQNSSSSITGNSMMTPERPQRPPLSQSRARMPPPAASGSPAVAKGQPAVPVQESSPLQRRAPQARIPPHGSPRNAPSHPVSPVRTPGNGLLEQRSPRVVSSKLWSPRNDASVPKGAGDLAYCTPPRTVTAPANYTSPSNTTGEGSTAEDLSHTSNSSAGPSDEARTQLSVTPSPTASTPKGMRQAAVLGGTAQPGCTPPRGLRPLRLSSAPRAPELLPSPLTERPQKSSLPYRAPPSASRVELRVTSTPVRAHAQRRTNSSTVSHAASLFGSPQSFNGSSQGETSVDSMSPFQPSAQRDLAEKLAAAEKANQDVNLKLTAVTAERDAAAARCGELGLELNQLRNTYDDTAAERDMHKDDVDGWRHRCSELEHTIQQQMLRLKQEQTWRHAAERRMQVLTDKVQTSAATSQSGRSRSSSRSGAHRSESHSSHASNDSDGEMAEVPPLPSMPSEHEMGDWSFQVARQLSRHAATEAEPDPSPETVRLLSDMRQQIMTLMAELELERSDHQRTAAQLENGRAVPQHLRNFSSEASASSASPSTPYAEQGEELWNTPRPPRRDEDHEASKNRRRAVALEPGAHSELQWLSRTDAPNWLEQEQTTDMLFPESRDDEHGTLSGLGLTPPSDRFNKPLPAQPEVPAEVPAVEGLFDESLLHESLDMSTSRRRASRTSWLEPDDEPKVEQGENDIENTSAFEQRLSLGVDLEVAGTHEDDWESEDEEDAPPVQLTDPTKRPEFIPEWSFDQALFEAKREMDAYSATGRRAGTLARRGHARLCHEPVNDFFGILDESTTDALPMPNDALAPPPIDGAILAQLYGAADPPAATKSMMKATCASPALAPRPYVPTETFLDLGEDISEPVNPRPSAIAQMLSWRPWRTSEEPAYDPEDYEASIVSDNLYGVSMEGDQFPSELSIPAFDLSSCRTPPPKDGYLAPAIPPPRTPDQRSPISGPFSPSTNGRRYLRPNTMTRIPVPTPAWCLDFESTTAAPGAPDVFTI